MHSHDGCSQGGIIRVQPGRLELYPAKLLYRLSIDILARLLDRVLIIVAFNNMWWRADVSIGIQNIDFVH
jgi:hypothetical protein